MKNRSPDQTVVSISIPKELLARIDARAASLNIPRSKYLGLLAKIDVDRGGALRIPPTPIQQAPSPVDSSEEIERFLEMAVPALADYQRRLDDPQAEEEEVDQPEAQAESRFWSGFLVERDEILKLKWIESKQAGYDIGFKRAIQLWLKHRPGWKAAQVPASG